MSAPTQTGEGLLPCPFCGDAVGEPDEDGNLWSVSCYRCELSGPSAGPHGWNHTREYASAAWNRRTPSPVPEASAGAGFAGPCPCCAGAVDWYCFCPPSCEETCEATDVYGEPPPEMQERDRAVRLYYEGQIAALRAQLAARPDSDLPCDPSSESLLAENARLHAELAEAREWLGATRAIGAALMDRNRQLEAERDAALEEARGLRELLREMKVHDERRYGAWTRGMHRRVEAALTTTPGAAAPATKGPTHE